ncbi:MAG: PatB family C-S lyase [bacterium]|nr:PatB family C-S lyase [bacterium]
MIYDFDTPLERRSTHSAKWNWFPADVLPLWVADMDLPAPEPVVRAIQARAEHAIFGYQMDSPPLRQVIVERFATRYRAAISPDAILFVPGLVTALNMICRTFGAPGDSVLVQPPIYPPFLSAPVNGGRTVALAPLARVANSNLAQSSLVDGATLRYEIDFDAMEAAITPHTRLFILCNPHNPVGRVFTRAELEQVAAFALRHDLIVVSDEIHCDLVYPQHEHHTFCTIAPELNDRLITLQAPSKTFNIAGLGCGFAVIPNAELRQQLMAALFNNGLIVNNLGLTAAEAAYRDGGEWHDQLMRYLRDNRDFVDGYVREHFPHARIAPVEGTYLAWVDFSGYDLPQSAYQFFLERAKVGLNDGATFGGESFAGCVRLNFGCPRATLSEALDRMRAALTG